MDDLDKLEAKAQAENRNRATSWMNKNYEKWWDKRMMKLDFNCVIPVELNELLRKSYAEIKSEKGQQLSPSTLAGNFVRHLLFWMTILSVFYFLRSSLLKTRVNYLMIQSDFEFTIHFNSQNAHSLYHLALYNLTKVIFLENIVYFVLAVHFNPVLTGSFFFINQSTEG